MEYKKFRTFPKMIHGGDYNPDQWKDTKEIWDEDIRLMKLSHCNTMSIGIFSWSALEPKEGVYNFEWLDEIMDKLADNGLYAILATPSGARPNWLSSKYPEVLRVDQNRVKHLHGLRHNHCFTSPAYREKVANINSLLAERYKDHPALLMWHVSNEYGGECHCELCQEAFRNWLREKYHNNIDEMNHAWWTGFWSHTYDDFSQVESPSPIGESRIHGLTLDWKRFVTYQTKDFIKNEIAPLRKITPDKLITTNFMGTYKGLNYWDIKDILDIVSWDNYPNWHSPQGDSNVASNISFVHDLYRSLKGGKPFMLMESTPSATNWHQICKLKRPKMHLLSSIQAIAHGSDTVQYFQWRKSRGSTEKFHGAVVDHCGHENTRVFKDVTKVGSVLNKLEDIVGTSNKTEVALIFDWENRWAINDYQGFNNINKKYEETCHKHYEAFWKKGVPVDVIDMTCDISKYKLVVAPMLYMLRSDIAKKIENFVNAGGTFVTTYTSGMVDENDLCFLGGFPGPLRKVMGIWAEETDALYDEDSNSVTVNDTSSDLFNKEYNVKQLCDLIHTETATSLATYNSDFYKNYPALTVNNFGAGKAYYIAFRNNDDFEYDFYNSLIKKFNIQKVIDTELPEGVTAQIRRDSEYDYVFIMNFTNEVKKVDLENNIIYKDMLNNQTATSNVLLDAYDVKVFRRKR